MTLFLFGKRIYRSRLVSKGSDRDWSQDDGLWRPCWCKAGAVLTFASNRGIVSMTIRGR